MWKREGAPGTGEVIGVSRPVIAGLVIVFLFFGVFLGWAAFAPLGSAAIARGTVSVEGNRKTVQHLEGGIVGEILVKDGDFVNKGQVLIKLDETQARASLAILSGRKTVALAEQARLIAERDRADKITFDPWLLERQDEPNVREAMLGQQNIFEARRLAYEGQITILEQKIAQLDEEVIGLEGQIASAEEQLALIQDELKDVEELVRKQLAKRTRLRSLQRTAAELTGVKGQSIAKIAQTKQAIGEIRLQITELGNSVLNEAVAQLRDVQSLLFDLSEQERSALDILNRTEVRAPNSGLVVNLQVYTTGGVIQPGSALLDIVPVDEKLVVGAEVNPTDIESVHIGAKAQIRFPAFSQRSTKPVDGTVVSVSADSLLNERTGTYYYQAQVEIESLEGSNISLEQLRPGMQADVMIATGERTALDYFLDPILASFSRGMTEQ
ncbi:HlyD family type I secretion periplasmic adaptor subunit [Sneathiella chinensis]|uniref:Membrane fusion protein (MFP) family protein n=1 Tax=Sneathiella chinensis TaxID=349750 RepID=A0ABQ5U708_9PROT|nr:HlyD family type I secretion periplasmic adaptor subunit [Sneathiella chinensis]GLQ07935.1 HlyD family type I secretion periplasmic adaptor subunit [Sneathiella chinensis]